MAKCLVIGGNGFLGSHVVDLLGASGHDVTVFDRFSGGKRLWSVEGVRSIQADFLSTEDLRAAIQGAELVFHFLSTSTPALADGDPTLDIRTNIAQSVQLLSLCVEADVKHVYFASTGGAMYGDNPSGQPTPESMVPAPVSPYAIGKLAIEGYLQYFDRTHGLASTSFRISNPYGSRQHPSKSQGVIPIFFERIVRGEPIAVYGDGSSVRDYIFVEDAARMITDVVGRTPRSAVYNIGSGHGTALSEIVRMVEVVTGLTAQVERRVVPRTFLDRVVLDVSRYEEEFGSRQLISLADGMALTWAELTHDD